MIEGCGEYYEDKLRVNLFRCIGEILNKIAEDFIKEGQIKSKLDIQVNLYFPKNNKIFNLLYEVSHLDEVKYALKTSYAYVFPAEDRWKDEEAILIDKEMSFSLDRRDKDGYNFMDDLNFIYNHYLRDNLFIKVIILDPLIYLKCPRCYRRSDYIGSGVDKNICEMCNNDIDVTKSGKEQYYF